MLCVLCALLLLCWAQFYYRHSRQSANKTMKMPLTYDSLGQPKKQEVERVHYMTRTKNQYYKMFCAEYASRLFGDVLPLQFCFGRVRN